jgi:hypothetical protein
VRLVPPHLRSVAPAPLAGGVLVAAGLGLLWGGRLWHAALGLEALAAAFWVWARAGDAPREQIARWAWLRRPATALWLAVALHAASPLLQHSPYAPRDGVFALLRWGEAIAVLWAGLELLAALPVARPFADLPGPLAAVGPWLPALLPAAGFAVLWRQAPHWLGVVEMREVAVALLVLTAWLGALRALGRRQWIVGLRWLFITDSAMAALLVALDVVPPVSSLLLWVGACGGRAYLLAGELRGQSPRRGPLLARLWRLAMTTASAALAWPALLKLGFAPGGAARPLWMVLLAVPVALAAGITTRRHVEAPERRAVVRPGPILNLEHGLALATLALGPAALALAWWNGFEASLVAGATAALPAAIGAAAAMPGRDLPWREPGRAAARGLFHAFVARERWLVAGLMRALRALAAPLRDLHTGDAQEYLLFVIGVAVFALLLPLFQ